MCKHKIDDLIGIEGGIKCRACGKIFGNFGEIEADRNIQESGNPDVEINRSKTAATEKDGVADNSIEQEKTEAVPAQGSKPKGAKTTKKKAVSTK